MTRRLLIWILGSSFVALGVTGGYWYWSSSTQEDEGVSDEAVALEDKKAEHRIVVFIHGTVGSTFGLLDLPSVMRDRLKGSIYTKTARSVRKDSFFFTGQPILERGFIKLDPSFNARDSLGFYAAYPITKAYDTLAGHLSDTPEERHYYLFGWSGLLSQTKRRLEAVRLYNALNEEVKKFKEQGVSPKVTIVSHSHGGNVTLNLGVIQMMLEQEVLDERVRNVIPGEVFASWEEYLRELPSKEDCAHVRGQKIRDYRPEHREFMIDRAILLGVPIQIETDFGVFSPIFDRVYNFYSLSDRVQTSDWVTTSQYGSAQRFDRLAQELDKDGIGLPERLVQTSIMLNQELDGECRLKKLNADQGKEKTSLWWRLLVGDYSPSEGPSSGPTHKELWFLMFNNNKESYVLKPLPVVSFLPVLVKLLERNPSLSDVDINISVRDRLCMELLGHDDQEIIDKECLGTAVLHSLREAALQWQVGKTLQSQELEKVSRHMRWGRGRVPVE
jgi:hypothetical protein